jgi:anti-sigma factor RsiW
MVLLHGLLDGQLDAVNALQFEEHLSHCDACRAEYAHQKEIRAAIRSVRDTAPGHLRLRIEASIDHVAAGRAAPQLSSGRRKSIIPVNWWISGLSMAVAACLALFIALPQSHQSPLEAQIVDSHVRSLLASHLTDIESSDRHTVRPWFSGKVDVAPPAIDLADKGFPLVGGRLDYLDDHVVAAVVYKRNSHAINVFARPAADAADLPPSDSSYRGFNLLHWRQAGVDFWAVTDASRSELDDFQKFYAAASAAG